MNKKFFLILSASSGKPAHPSIISTEDFGSRLVEADGPEEALKKWSEDQGYRYWETQDRFDFVVYEVNLVGPLLEVAGTPFEIFKAAHQ